MVELVRAKLPTTTSGVPEPDRVIVALVTIQTLYRSLCSGPVATVMSPPTVFVPLLLVEIGRRYKSTVLLIRSGRLIPCS